MSLTMSSREIAELTGKQHKHVLRDITTMLDGLRIPVAQFWAAAQVSGPNNSTRNVKVFNLPKRETLILVSGYNVQMRAKSQKPEFRLSKQTKLLIDEIAKAGIPALETVNGKAKELMDSGKITARIAELRDATGPGLDLHREDRIRIWVETDWRRTCLQHSP